MDFVLGSLEAKELRREKQDLVATVTKLTGEKEQVGSENDRLKSKLSEMDSKSKQWDSLYVENNKLKTKQAELERRIQELEKAKRGLQNEKKQLQADLLNLQTKNSSMERKMGSLETENNQLVDRMEKKRKELDEFMKAMNTETSAEVALKEANTELEFAKNKLADYKKELDEVNHRYEVLEKEKDSAKTALRLKESEFKGMKANFEENDTEIRALKVEVDAAKQNINRLEDAIEDAKVVEKDSVNLKARIRTLKTEMEDSLADNHKIKQERMDAQMETHRVARDLLAITEGLSEARSCIEKLEGERRSREQLDEEVAARKKREPELERQAYDANVRSEQLRARVLEMETERQALAMDRDDVVSAEIHIKQLMEENKKLRLMLVERNMEMTQSQAERQMLTTRLAKLERQHCPPQTAKGWMNAVSQDEDDSDDNCQTRIIALPHTLTHRRTHNQIRTQPPLSLPHVHSHPLQHHPKYGGVGMRDKPRGKDQLVTSSWENGFEINEQSDSVDAPSLPTMRDGKLVLAENTDRASYPGSYYDLYQKNKVKLIKTKKL
ncbi:MAG: hypothetical protein KAG66_02435 [Methylococcales bacterium]|nr:hypothetical protein [Methylococcales bacterium]